jgi:dTDP-4-dehydrorhamnose reductase
MNVLILGANGQLGQSFAERVQFHQGSKHEFTFLGKNDVDITDLDTLMSVATTVCPDVVINAAAWTDVKSAEDDYEMAFNVNVLGVSNIAKATNSLKTRMIQVSTDYVFKGDGCAPIGESEDTNPINNYGRTKAEAEKYLLSNHSDRSLIIRTAWLYGPFGSNFLKSILRKGLTRPSERLEVVCDQWGQPTSSLDLAEAILNLALSNAQSGVFHGTNAGATNWFDFARIAFEHAGLDPTRITPIKSSEMDSKVSRPKYSVLGHDSWGLSGYEAMRHWEEPLQEIVIRIRADLETTYGV